MFLLSSRAPRPSDANQTFLDESGFAFVARCTAALESRGLEEQGLYRVVGVASKVTRSDLPFDT